MGFIVDLSFGGLFVYLDFRFLVSGLGCGFAVL